LAKLTPTTKDVALLRQLHDEGQLELAPQFQRNAVWPRPAKAYLIDTILNERPIPLLFFQRISSAQTGRSSYRVIDGQQRLRAIFEFIENKFSLTQSINHDYKGKKYKDLPEEAKDKILQYDLPIQELSGYTDNDIRDMFLRMNKYVVKLSPQEIRRASKSGAFAKFAESLGKLPFWKDNGVFSKGQIARFKSTEFCAELAILLQEGPQDKKAAVDVYYAKYDKDCPFESDVKSKLDQYLKWIGRAIPNVRISRFRKPTDLYSLIGALDESWLDVKSRNAQELGVKLIEFASRLKPDAAGSHGRYLAAASRQTDNLKPRQTRIDEISQVLLG
jgi:uncharacterized protein with ParB-like and HNH nuclease domain